MRAALLAGMALGFTTGWPAANPYGVGWADAPCPQAGRTISEDFYQRVYVRDCPYTWRSDTESGMSVSGEPNAWVHFKASARCSDAEWYRRVVVGREDRRVCQHRGGKAVPT